MKIELATEFSLVLPYLLLGLDFKKDPTIAFEIFSTKSHYCQEA